jgi:RNA polymerase sigma factor (sigma-70 family)
VNVSAEDPRELGHLFRREAGRMVAALVRIFGLHNLALAEDVVQDALCRALEVWKYGPLPENPSAWLMAAAKNRAIDVLRNEKRSRAFAPDVGFLLETEWTLVPTVTALFDEHEVRDDQLRMMFSCCHPKLPAIGQVTLILNVLCGFSVGEIAGAFLTNEAAVEKRLQRAKKSVARSEALYEVAGAKDLGTRIDAVERALYLLFNEGYHGAHPHLTVRSDLCEEAMRLTGLLLSHPACARKETSALLALMCLHTARLSARVDRAGDLAPLQDQDRSLWDKDLIARGLALLDESASGPFVCEYQIEAAIAAVHCTAPSYAETDWKTIARLYDSLYEMSPSPVVALSRAIAHGQVEGPERGIDELERIADRKRLDHYPFYAAALGEFCLSAGRTREAKDHFLRARSLARNPAEERFLDRKLALFDAAAHAG